MAKRARWRVGRCRGLVYAVGTFGGLDLYRMLICRWKGGKAHGSHGIWVSRTSVPGLDLAKLMVNRGFVRQALLVES